MPIESRADGSPTDAFLRGAADAVNWWFDPLRGSVRLLDLALDAFPPEAQCQLLGPTEA